MVTVLRTLTALLLFAGIMVCGEVAWTIQKIRPELEVTISNVDRATIAAGAAAANVEKASRAWQQASKDQSSKTTKAMSDVSAAAEQFTMFVSRTDASVNGVLVPQLKTSIEQQNAALLDNQKQLQASLQNVAESSTGLQKFLTDADVQISNPQIKKSVDNVAVSTENLAVATDQAAATMKSVKSGVDYEVAQIEKPVSKVKAVLLFVVKLAGQFW